MSSGRCCETWSRRHDTWRKRYIAEIHIYSRELGGRCCCTTSNSIDEERTIKTPAAKPGLSQGFEFGYKDCFLLAGRVFISVFLNYFLGSEHTQAQ